MANNQLAGEYQLDKFIESVALVQVSTNYYSKIKDSLAENALLNISQKYKPLFDKTEAKKFNSKQIAQMKKEFNSEVKVLKERLDAYETGAEVLLNSLHVSDEINEKIIDKMKEIHNKLQSK